MFARLFIALPLSPQTQNKFIEWQNKHSDLPVRWLKGKNMHITLIPPWQEESPETIIKILKNVGPIPKINLIFEKINLGRGVIWAVAKKNQELENLKKILEKTLIENHIIENVDSRPFFPHLTLARFRDYLPQNIDEKISITETANSIVLMQSHLSPSGADYEILAEIS